MRKSLQAAIVAGVAAVALASTSAAAVAAQTPTRDGTATPAAAVPAAEQYFDVLRADLPGLDATAYVPTTLGASTGQTFPVLVWGNGGCRANNEEIQTLLSQVAAHGFLIIADGAASTRFTVPPGPGSAAKLLSFVDAAVTAQSLPPLIQASVDVEKVAVGGQSCGGVRALAAGADPRIDSVIAMNGSTGFAGADMAVIDGLQTAPRCG